MTEPEEKKGVLTERTKILVLIGLILVLFGVGYAYDHESAWVFLWLSYYSLYLLVLTLTDRPGISFPNAYKVLIALLALLGVYALAGAWISSSFWAGVGPHYGEHVKTILEAIIELLEYLKVIDVTPLLWTPPKNGVILP